MRRLITLVEDLRSKEIGFRTLNEGAIDTMCASGELNPYRQRSGRRYVCDDDGLRTRRGDGH